MHQKVSGMGRFDGRPLKVIMYQNFVTDRHRDFISMFNFGTVTRVDHLLFSSAKQKIRKVMASLH